MGHTKLSIAALFTCLALGLVSCKGSNTIGGGSTAPNASVIGLWGGTDSDNPDLTLNVIINSAGEMVAIRSDGVQFTGTLQISGDSLAASLAGYANFGSSFPDNSIYGIGTLNGTVTPGTAITATIDFTTNGNTSIPGDWSLTPGTLTNVGSSLASVTGSFTDTVTAATVSITATGVMTSTNPTTGCVLNGTISTPDVTIDEYQVNYTLASCAANYAVLNGVNFAGLGYLDNTTSPSTLTYAVSGSSTNGNFGIVSILSGP
jgi:hypothetical protein